MADFTLVVDDLLQDNKLTPDGVDLTQHNVLAVDDLSQAQTLSRIMLTYWYTVLDWPTATGVAPAKGTRRLLHPLHESRFRH